VTGEALPFPALAAAFLGGLLALLAPCSALLLPAFLAYACANTTALLRATLLFTLGLCLVLLPLGLAASLAGGLLIEQREATILVAGAALIFFGLLLIAGRGFSLAPAKLQTLGGSATLATGVVYGLTGYCSGPLLGGVLTMVAVSHSLLIGASLLVVYASGMVAPLLILAFAWDRLDLGHRAWLRATTRRSNVLGGVLFATLGLVFIASQGGLLLSGAYDSLGLTDLGFRLEDWVAGMLNP
jgi:cytochrome c biogenesis protein CcdA